MTAGSGVIHQEMPKGDEKGKMSGFQLWANLPSRKKMMDPRYREVTHEQIPEVKLPNGTTIRIISGEVSGVKGPVQGIVIDPEYIDVTVPANSEFRHPAKRGHMVLAYIIDGQGYFSREKNPFAYEMEGRNYFEIQRDPSVGNGMIVLKQKSTLKTATRPLKYLVAPSPSSIRTLPYQTFFPPLLHQSNQSIGQV